MSKAGRGSERQRPGPAGCGDCSSADGGDYLPQPRMPVLVNMADPANHPSLREKKKKTARPVVVAVAAAGAAAAVAKKAAQRRRLPLAPEPPKAPRSPPPSSPAPHKDRLSYLLLLSPTPLSISCSSDSLRSLSSSSHVKPGRVAPAAVGAEPSETPGTRKARVGEGKTMR